MLLTQRSKQRSDTLLAQRSSSAANSTQHSCICPSTLRFLLTSPASTTIKPLPTSTAPHPSPHSAPLSYPMATRNDLQNDPDVQGDLQAVHQSALAARRYNVQTVSPLSLELEYLKYGRQWHDVMHGQPGTSLTPNGETVSPRETPVRLSDIIISYAAFASRPRLPHWRSKSWRPTSPCVLASSVPPTPPPLP